jgi:hypothetical protein
MNPNVSIRSRRRVPACLPASVLVLALAGCGGGGGGGATPAPDTPCQATCVSGTAATGRPIGQAAVTLTDTLGAIRSATTGADGTYRIDPGTGVAPFLLKVVTAQGSTYYSVSTGTQARTTVNLTPLTDLIVRTWYGAQGIEADAAFNAPAAHPAPPPAAVPALAAGVQRIVQLWLDRHGVPAGFDLIATPFAADGTGADAVLDATTVALAGLDSATVTISGGTLTQSSSLAIGAGSLTVLSTLTDSATGAASSSVTSSALPTAPGATDTLDALTALLDAFAATVNDKGSSLAAADLQPYVDPDLLDDGEDAAQFSAHVASDLAGSVIGFDVVDIAELDPAGDRAELRLMVTQAAEGQSATEALSLRFRRLAGEAGQAGPWVITGNGRAYRFDAQAEMRTDQGANAGWNRCDGSAGGPGLSINVGVQALPGRFSGGSVSGAGAIWPDRSDALPTQCVASGPLKPGGSIVEGGLTFETFFLNTGPIAAANLPAAATLLTASMLPAAGGAPVTASVSLNAWTSEPVTFTAPASSALSALVLGAATPVSWTLPVTYAIQSVQLSAIAFDGDSSLASTTGCIVEAAPLAPNSRSGSIVIPATCAGQPVVQVNLNLGVNGVNGERSMAILALE